MMSFSFSHLCLCFTSSQWLFSAHTDTAELYIFICLHNSAFSLFCNRCIFFIFFFKLSLTVPLIYDIFVFPLHLRERASTSAVQLNCRCCSTWPKHKYEQPFNPTHNIYLYLNLSFQLVFSDAHFFFSYAILLRSSVNMHVSCNVKLRDVI